MAKSKILGEPFDEYVSKQIEVRQNRLGTSQKTADDLKVFNASTPWIRLSSSVSVDATRAKKLAERLGPNVTTEQVQGYNLAKNLVLFAGSSEALDSKIRGGLTRGGFDGSYGFLSDPKTQGYKPMPGLSNVNVNYKNNGSLKQAQVNIKCFSKGQFEALETLYLRLGYTLILEWGHSMYYDNSTEKQNMSSLEIPNALFQTDSNIGSKILTKSIADNKDRTGGNYDAIVAKVSNFSWTLNNDLSYDIILNLVSVGDVIDSLKMNLGGGRGVSKENSKVNGKVNQGLQNILNLRLSKEVSLLNAFLYDLTDELLTKTSKTQFQKTTQKIVEDLNLVETLVEEAEDKKLKANYISTIKAQRSAFTEPYDKLIEFLNGKILIKNDRTDQVTFKYINSEATSSKLLKKYLTLALELPPFTYVNQVDYIYTHRFIKTLGYELINNNMNSELTLKRDTTKRISATFENFKQVLADTENYIKNLNVTGVTNTEEKDIQTNTDEINFLIKSLPSRNSVLINLYEYGAWEGNGRNLFGLSTGTPLKYEHNNLKLKNSTSRNQFLEFIKRDR